MVRGADALVAMWGGPPHIAEPDGGVTMQVVVAPIHEIGAAVATATRKAADAGKVVTAVLPLGGAQDAAKWDVAVMLTFRPVRPVYRPVVPGEAAYDAWEELAREGGAYMAYLISAYLPEKEPTVPLDPDDPEDAARMDGVRPLGAEEHEIANVKEHDDGAPLPEPVVEPTVAPSFDDGLVMMPPWAPKAADSQ